VVLTTIYGGDLDLRRHTITSATTYVSTISLETDLDLRQRRRPSVVEEHFHGP